MRIQLVDGVSLLLFFGVTGDKHTKLDFVSLVLQLADPTHPRPLRIVGCTCSSALFTTLSTNISIFALRLIY